MEANLSINNLPKFTIAYTGFEKAVQKEMEKIIFSNKRIFEKFLSLPNFFPACNNDVKFNIGVVYLRNNLKHNYRHLQTVNSSVLCVSDFDRFETVLECITKGFGGCVSYSDLFKELVPAIISVLQNKTYISPSFFPVLYDDLQINNADTHLFTYREQNLIELLTKGALYKEIAGRLHISENTVRSHIRHIYSKLKVHSKTEMAVKIMSGKMISSLVCFLTDCIGILIM